MSAFPVCDFCGMHYGDHENTCPYGEHPSWDRDPEPAKRGREEDRAVHPDLRETGDMWP